MKTLKPHSHSERQKIVDELIPQIKKKFGDNLLALASLPSFSTGHDLPYSDLELLAFIQEGKSGGTGFIYKGLLIEIYWQTKEFHLNKLETLENDCWEIDTRKMKAIINQEFIEKIHNHTIRNLEKKYKKRTEYLWLQTQEATGKVLNEIEKNNTENIGYLFFAMIKDMIKLIASLNKSSYQSASTYISEAKQFKMKPKTFDILLEILVTGLYQDLEKLKEITKQVFSEFETLLEEQGHKLNKNSLEL